MPYLKSSQITGLSPKRVDVTGFTQSAAEDLEGTYSQHEVLLADAFNVTDNVTISDNLILAKLSDDGNAITVTGDASTTRTISGSGSLEGSTFAQTPNASMTGMTGTMGSGVILGSAVTGSPALNLSNTTGQIGHGRMPSGSILQVHSVFGEGTITNQGGTYTYYLIESNPNQFSTTEQHTISVVSKMTNSYWYFHCNDHIYYTNSVIGGSIGQMFMYSGWSFSSASGYTYLEIGHNYHDARSVNNIGGQEMHSESAQQLIKDISQAAGTTVYFTYKTTRVYNGSEDGAVLTIMEVAP